MKNDLRTYILVALVGMLLFIICLSIAKAYNDEIQSKLEQDIKQQEYIYNFIK